MPENRYYTVTQEREVKVSATSPLEAAEFAQHVFDGKPLEGEIQGRIRSAVRDRDLNVREDY